MNKNLIKKYLNILRGATISQMYYDFDKSVENTVFVAGVGRSGTTWLSELINYDRSYRFLFEPFWPRRVKKCSIFDLEMYIRPNELKPRHLQVAKDILRGNIRNLWADRFNEKRLPKYRIVKDIRANLLLKWLALNTENMPIIFIMRHPCAVALSKEKIFFKKGAWEPNVSKFLSQGKLMKDYLSDFKFIFNRYDEYNFFEKKIIEWCIKNYIPLKQFDDDEMLLVFYEDLCLNPQRVLDKVFGFIGKEWAFDEKLKSKISKPSALSKEDSAIRQGENLITKWIKEIEKKDLLKTAEIIKCFNLDKIYTIDSPKPNGSFKLSNF